MSVYQKCVVCDSDYLKPLFFVNLRGILHGEPGHNIAYGYKEVDVCESCGCGQLEVYDHDCWSHEDPWNKIGRASCRERV